jgi:pilus assembly protein CpaB
MKPKSLVLLGVSGLFGLVAAGLFLTALGQPGGASEMKDVLIAADDIEIGALLTEENCRLEPWPVNIIPEGTVTSFDEVMEKRVNTRLTKGVPVFQRDLLDKYANSMVPVPKGKKVVGLKVPSEDHIAGLLQPGHTVDVIGVFDKQEKSYSSTFLRGIKVFSVSNKVSLDPENGKSTEDDITVGLVVTERQSEMLTLVKQTANVKLAIRGVEDTEFARSPVEDKEGMISLSDMMPQAPQAADAEGDVDTNRSSFSQVGNIFNQMMSGASGNRPKRTSSYEPFRMQVFLGDYFYEYDIEDGKIPVLVTAPPPEDSESGVSTGAADEDVPVERP